MTETLHLQNGPCALEVSAYGAEIISWRMGGRELIWHGDERWWPRRAPTLFPFCGWLNGGKFRAKGQTYETNVHGFGRETDFELSRLSATTAALRLVDSEQTKAKFPYAFDLRLTVTATPDGARLDYAVHNPGDEPLPYALGFHPGFIWPFAGGTEADYRVEFERDETFRSPVIAPGGLFTQTLLEGLPFDGRRLDVFNALKRQESLCLLAPESRRAAFVAADGSRIEIALEDFANWVVWRKPGGAFLCIEGWTGQGDPVGFSDEIAIKPGMILLAPGETRRHAFAFRLA